MVMRSHRLISATVIGLLVGCTACSKENTVNFNEQDENFTEGSEGGSEHTIEFTTGGSETTGGSAGFATGTSGAAGQAFGGEAGNVFENIAGATPVGDIDNPASSCKDIPLGSGENGMFWVNIDGNLYNLFCDGGDFQGDDNSTLIYSHDGRVENSSSFCMSSSNSVGYYDHKYLAKEAVAKLALNASQIKIVWKYLESGSEKILTSKPNYIPIINLRNLVPINYNGGGDISNWESSSSQFDVYLENILKACESSVSTVGLDKQYPVIFDGCLGINSCNFTNNIWDEPLRKRMLIFIK